MILVMRGYKCNDGSCWQERDEYGYDDGAHHDTWSILSLFYLTCVCVLWYLEQAQGVFVVDTLDLLWVG